MFLALIDIECSPIELTNLAPTQPLRNFLEASIAFEGIGGPGGSEKQIWKIFYRGDHKIGTTFEIYKFENWPPPVREKINMDFPVSFGFHAQAHSLWIRSIQRGLDAQYHNFFVM